MSTNELPNIDNGDEEWTRQRTKLMISTRLGMEAEFQKGKRSKKTLWRVVHQEIVDVDSSFSFSKEEITKKFQNLLTTYKRIKKRNSQTGRGTTIWEYFDEFDKIYGSSHFIEPPPNNLLDTSHPLEEISNPNEPENANLQPSSPNNIETASRPRKRRAKVQQADILEELRRHDENEERRHREFVELEREKLNIEKEKVQLTKELKNIFLELN